ncbi:Hint domain-containing protein [Acidocella sp. C78]|uniref:Hint domain-containing protein n=1 Tax=Acidocella sp. C78 TaxID=1671486 RepID=UPI0020C180EA|nr:Hint domain-containing protein [Acidocella sp. C78]
MVESSVLNGANLQVSAGGASLDNTVTGTNGQVNVSSGGIVSGTFVSAGATANYQTGAIVDQPYMPVPTVLTGFSAWSAVNSGGATVYTSGSTTVSGPVVLGNTTLDIQNGAIVSGLTVSSGANAAINVSSGGELLSSVLTSATNATVSQGGTVLDSVISSGATVNVQSGATATSNTAVSGGVLSANTGATLSNNIAGVGGFVSSGNAVSGGFDYRSGTVTNVPILSGGTWSAVSTGSGTVYQSGSTTYSGQVALEPGATLNILSGAVVSGLLTPAPYNGNNTVNVSAGGELLSSVLINGFLNVSSGGVTSGNVLNSNAETISSGGSSINDIYANISGSGVNDANGPTVQSGATISGATVTSGGYLVISSGANASNNTATVGGFISSITNSGTNVVGGFVDINGGQVTNVPVLSGTWSAVSTGSGTVYESGSTTYTGRVALDAGATLNISSGAVVSGLLTPAPYNGNNTVNVSAGGTLLSSVLINGILNVSSGGVTSGNVLNSNLETISSGGSSINDTYINVASSGFTDSNGPTVQSGATISGATVTSGGYLVISSGATASNNTATAGGLISSVTNAGTNVVGGFLDKSGNAQNNVPILSGGTWSAVSTGTGTVYQSGATTYNGPIALGANTTLIVESGAVVSGLNTPAQNGGNTVSVNSGGELLNSILTHGYLYVNSGGVTSGNLLNSDPVTISSGGESIGDTFFNSGYATQTVTVSSGGQIYNPTIVPGGAGLTLDQGASSSPNNPCFAEGTLIATARGPVPVENLSAGETVILHDGGTAPVVWLGRRTIDLTRHPRPETVQPIVISAHAIAEGVPARDLVVSPDHAFYLDGLLIPAKILVNGVTIRQIEMREVTYFHVELPFHAVLLAEGMAAESYLETGNRAAFENGGQALILHPDFAQTLRETRSCAPFADHGAVVERVRARILDRAGIEMTSEADIATIYRADGSVVIASRVAVPGELTADPRDRRELGVKIGALKAGDELIALDHPRLAEGWHDVEANGRWTNGAAVIPADLVRGRDVEITVASTLSYPVITGSRMAARG